MPPEYSEGRRENVMGVVIDFGEWKRARLGKRTSLHRRRARAVRGKGENPASIGELSAELLRLLQTE
jgi:hypothetical protein